MINQIIKRKEIAEAIRAEIETLETVDSAVLFNGIFEFNDFQRVSTSAEFGTCCFIHLAGGVYEYPKQNIATNRMRVSIYVYGLQDLDEEERKVGISEMCWDTMDEIDGLITNNNFNFALPQSTFLESWEDMPPSQDEEERYRIMGYRMNFEITIKSNFIQQFQK